MGPQSLTGPGSASLSSFTVDEAHVSVGLDTGTCAELIRIEDSPVRQNPTDCAAMG